MFFQDCVDSLIVSEAKRSFAWSQILGRGADAFHVSVECSNGLSIAVAAQLLVSSWHCLCFFRSLLAADDARRKFAAASLGIWSVCPGAPVGTNQPPSHRHRLSASIVLLVSVPWPGQLCWLRALG